MEDPDDGGPEAGDSILRAFAASPELPVPERLGSRIAHFRLDALLGRGGMGAVYRALDEKLRRDVALKLLPPTRDAEKRARFLREARLAAAITHPNVAVVYAVDEADGRVYIAMELVEGENLRWRMDRGPLDVATALELATQIARGLAAAHDKQIVHRDLKPENVMITPAGVVKLLDFGLAKSEATSNPTTAALAKTETVVTSDEGRIMGTPGYMSPEQALGEALDVRSDVFSFGIVLYEMLAGARPFSASGAGATRVAIVRDAPPPLRAQAPQVDEHTASVVMRCLEKVPDARFAHAAEIVAALSPGGASRVALGSGSNSGPGAPDAARKRRSARAVLLLGVGAGALVLAAILARSHGRAPAPTPSAGSSSASREETLRRARPRATPAAGSPRAKSKF